MLTLTLPDVELYDEKNNQFMYAKGQTITLEHSLVSVSKWESKWKIPFLSGKTMTAEQTRDYIRCMTITQNVNPILFSKLTQETLDIVTEYIQDPQTATWFSEKDKQKQGGGSNRPITSELIYYWMIESGIPMECQKWHLNRLLTLIEVCNAERKAADPNNKKRYNPRDLAKSRSALNAQRRAAMHTRG